MASGLTIRPTQRSFQLQIVFAGMDRRDVTLLCILDASKCFDTIPHAVLLRKLDQYGVDTRWFASYLANHYQQVLVREPSGKCSLSSSLPNPIGTYQGSALGPLLFTIYANDLPLYANGADVTQYADDVQVQVSGPVRDVGTLVQRLESSLSSLAKWFAQNGMKINAQKTQFTVLGTLQNLQRLPPITITFMGERTECSSTVLNLGVRFDQCMTFSRHVDDVTRKCAGLLCGLSHSRHCLPVSTLVTIVQNLVVSRIRYCLAVYGVCGVVQMRRLQKILNFAARVISGRRRFEHVGDVLHRLDWLTAENLYLYHGLCILKKIISTSEPDVLADFITRGDIHQRNTRNADHLALPAIRSESGRRRFKYAMVAAYNDLPASIRGLGRGAFKSALRRMLLDRQRLGVG